MERLRNWRTEGFTLVELALVLVIIGLLITGILKGEALIRNAKVKNLVNQKNTLTAAFYTYYDRFQYYPGDANIANIPTNGHTDGGNADGQIAGNERWVLFQDLSLAQIINGGYTGAANSCPTNTFGGTAIIVYVGNAGWPAAINQNCIQFTTVPANVCQEVDTKYDDGVWNTGNIRTNATYVGSTANLTLTWGMSAQ